MEGVLQTQAHMISVIVPVYKVEKYLRACIDSILAQTYRNFELILVDDGSPDNCGAICDAYAAKDPRVRVIHQENMGLSGARNTGMDAARGEYITFVDSDDLILPQYLEVLLDALRSANAELSVCSPEIFIDGEENKMTASDQTDFSYSALSGREACICMYNGDRRVPINAWGKLYLRSLIGDMRFPVGRIHEDQAFVPPVCFKAAKAAVSDAALYHYRERGDSITRERFSLKRYDDIWAIDRCIAFFREKNEPEIVEAAERKRKRLLAVYSIYARRDGVTVPKEYRVGLLRALRYLRKNVNPMKYEYYLAQVSPFLARVYVYERKLKRMLRGEKK